MSTLEKEINGLLKSRFIEINLHKILDDANKSYQGILAKGRAQGMEIDPESDRHVVHKCLFETTNKYIVEEIKSVMVNEEQTYSKQPLLLAHPSGY